MNNENEKWYNHLTDFENLRRDFAELRKDFDQMQKSMSTWVKWGLQLVLSALIIAILSLVIGQ